MPIRMSSETQSPCIDEKKIVLIALKRAIDQIELCRQIDRESETSELR